MDSVKWIDMMISIFVNNNIIYIMDYQQSGLSQDKYNFIYIFATYLLEELNKYSGTIFSPSITIDVDVNMTLYDIKNRILYNDDGSYFEKNLIFDCLIKK